jgi:hypothetical protein
MFTAPGELGMLTDRNKTGVGADTYHIIRKSGRGEALSATDFVVIIVSSLRGVLVAAVSIDSGPVLPVTGFELFDRLCPGILARCSGSRQHSTFTPAITQRIRHLDWLLPALLCPGRDFPSPPLVLA